MSGAWIIDRVLKRREFLALLLLSVLVLAAFLFPLEQYLVNIQLWTHQHPDLATWLVSSAFFLGVLLLLPVSPIVLFAGLLFGLTTGFLVIWLSGLIASALAFWLGRYLARPWVERSLLNKTLLSDIDGAFHKNGLWLVLLSRLAMVLPFGPVSYSLGLSGVRFRDYFIGSNIGVIPAYLLVVYLGTTASDVAAVLSGNLEVQGRDLVTVAAILSVMVVGVGVIARLAYKALRAELGGPRAEIEVEE